MEHLQHEVKRRLDTKEHKGSLKTDKTAVWTLPSAGILSGKQTVGESGTTFQYWFVVCIVWFFYVFPSV